MSTKMSHWPALGGSVYGGSGSGTTLPAATNHGLENPGLPYKSGLPSAAMTVPPAASNTACPAAVSHSIVVPRRGYRSAAPRATRQNFNDDPIDTVSATL